MDHPPGAAPGKRRRTRVDWELVVCGVRGHVLVGRDVEELRPEDGLFARETAGVRWHRCMRCDSWVALALPDSPAARHPPERDEIVIPNRGKALRDKIILRLIAVDRAIHFLILVLLGIGVLAFANDRNFRTSFYKVVTALQNGVGGGPVQQGGHTGFFHELDRLFTLRHGTLRDVGLVLLAYGLLEGVEAVGLWRTKRWAEYLTFIATTILLIPEVYEMTNRITALKLIGFIINLAVVIYLLYAKRLFGLRGGGAVDARERAEAVSWANIERATPPGGAPGALSPPVSQSS